MHRHSSGFSLLIVAVLLAISGIILASLLPGKGDYNQKVLTNVQKLGKVEDAMVAFMNKNGRRPCPSDGTPPGNANFAIEAGVGGACASAPLSNVAYPNVVGGTIPTATLGLPDDYGVDAFGHRFTYVVDTRATYPATANVQACPWLQNYPDNSGTGGVFIENTTGGTVIDNVMYAYISYGASGHGAWPADSATRINAASNDADSNNNAGWTNNVSFSAAFTNTFVKKDKVLPSDVSGFHSGFDNLVYYRNDIKNICCIGTACLLSSAGFHTSGAASDTAGTAVAVGDFNGDGIPDLAIGAPNGNGKVYILFGSRLGFLTPAINGGFEIDGQSGDKLGSSLAVGDVNGDGIQDLIIGAPGYNSGKGAAYVVYGHTGTWSGSIGAGSLTSSSIPAGFILADTTADKAGTSVAAADINGDGYADIIIGAPGASGASAGKVFVVLGQAFGLSSYNLNSSGILNGITGIEIDGENSADNLGTAVAAGDINGDGYADIIAGAPNANSSAGYTYVIFGNSGTNFSSITMKGGGPWSTPTTLSTGSAPIDGTNGFRLNGSSGDNAGTAVATGDINGDGYADIIVGAPGASSNGSVYVAFGGPSISWSATQTLSSLTNGANGVRFNGANTGDKAGTSLATGDINGDGIQDLIIGAPGYNGGAGAGAVYVVFGATNWSSPFALSGLTGNNGFVLTGGANSALGTSVCAGDINGDGLWDVIAGAPTAGSGGIVYTLYGTKGWTSGSNPSLP